jgi:hypothetical protein
MCTKIAISQKFHLQPFASMRKPPTMGPTHGPIVGPIIQTLQVSCSSVDLCILENIDLPTIAVPLCSREIKSAIVPPPSTSGAPPAHPIRNRKAINMPMLDDTAAAIVNTMNSRLQLWYNQRRPNISDKGAMTILHSSVSYTQIW